MKNILTFLLLVLFQTVFAQQNEGAIKTKSGFLLYFNLGFNSHTLNLKGDIDISNFPFVKQDNTWFQFYTASKLDFGKDSKSILINYMNWEIDYLQKQMNVKLNINNETLNRNGVITNFWKFKNPVIKDDKIHTIVVATYFLDFIHNDLIYRLSYASTSGNDFDAKTILLNIADNIKFYDRNIDLDKLQKNILDGKNYIDN